jgi:23S rRNA pseudoU1915 N3-methylase RlmH
MKITLLLTGISDDKDLAPVIDRYVKRLAHYGPFEVQELKASQAICQTGH